MRLLRVSRGDNTIAIWDGSYGRLAALYRGPGLYDYCHRCDTMSDYTFESILESFQRIRWLSPERAVNVAMKG